MNLEILKSSPKGTITAPASKSASHRLLICAGLSKGRSVIKNVAFSQDILATLRCLEAIGCKTEIENDTVTIDGIKNFDAVGSEILDCNESGSTLRFFIPICLLSGKNVKLTGSGRLLSRPLTVYEEICKKQGISIKNDGKKITLDGKLKSDIFEVKGNISSQFISGLLFALPLLKNDSIIKIIPPFESRPYVDMTLDAMKNFGITAAFLDNFTIAVSGSQTYKPANIAVEGDWSNAAFLYAFKESGADVNITGLNRNSTQGDKICIEYFKKIKDGFCTLDLSDCPDLAPILFAFSAKHRGAEFTGTDRLRIKESDRISAMAQELSKFGAVLHAGDNKVVVEAKDFHRPSEPLCVHNDHRIVMSMAYLLSFTGGVIEGYEAVRKSWPDFFKVIQNAGVKINYEA
ncbi:MAG: 3-phosphoshikimate 1-carboxyvinyltransferase [Clostridia bacterium]|nr:3-phosphoshikimate 1-carboxyvinyltransferase [Clostridia bacterium]